MHGRIDESLAKNSNDRLSITMNMRPKARGAKVEAGGRSGATVTTTATILLRLFVHCPLHRCLIAQPHCTFPFRAVSSALWLSPFTSWASVFEGATSVHASQLGTLLGQARVWLKFWPSVSVRWRTDQFVGRHSHNDAPYRPHYLARWRCLLAKKTRFTISNIPQFCCTMDSVQTE